MQLDPNCREKIGVPIDVSIPTNLTPCKILPMTPDAWREKKEKGKIGEKNMPKYARRV